MVPDGWTVIVTAAGERNTSADCAPGSFSGWAQADAASRHNRTVAELAIAWALRRSEVTGAIVGARSPAQIEATVAAGDWQLSDDVVAEIDVLLAARQSRLQALGPLDAGRV